MRHSSLPPTLTDEALQTYLMKYAIEKHDDNKRRYFTSEEIAEKEHESASFGLAMVDLNAILTEAGEAIKKGTNVEKIIIIPETIGLATLDKFRSQRYREIKQGYEETPVKIYGLVFPDENLVRYFTLDGEIVEDRTRQMSARERQEYGQRRIGFPEATGTNG